jgi:hypothetical protein
MQDMGCACSCTEGKGASTACAVQPPTVQASVQLQAPGQVEAREHIKGGAAAEVKTTESGPGEHIGGVPAVLDSVESTPTEPGPGEHIEGVAAVLDSAESTPTEPGLAAPAANLVPAVVGLMDPSPPPAPAMGSALSPRAGLMAPAANPVAAIDTGAGSTDSSPSPAPAADSGPAAPAASPVAATDAAAGSTDPSPSCAPATGSVADAAAGSTDPSPAPAAGSGQSTPLFLPCCPSLLCDSWCRLRGCAS